MRTADEPIISADDHMDLNVLPPRLFVDRLPARLRDAAPRVVDTPDGPVWHVDGRLLVGPSGGARPRGFIVHEEHGFRPGQPEQPPSPTWTANRVYTQVIYGPPGGTSRSRTWRCGPAVCRRTTTGPTSSTPWTATASWLLALLARRHPGGGVDGVGGGPPTWATRARLVGLFESDVPLFEEPWETFWATADEVGLPIHFPSAVASTAQGPAQTAGPAGHGRGGAHCSSTRPSAAMVFSGLLERHPNVKPGPG